MRAGTGPSQVTADVRFIGLRHRNDMIAALDQSASEMRDSARGHMALRREVIGFRGDLLERHLFETVGLQE